MSLMGFGGAVLGLWRHSPAGTSLVAFRVKDRAPRHDIPLIGWDRIQIGIEDSKRDVRHVVPRYAILITPAWLQDQRSPENCRTCQKLMGSAGLVDVCIAQWRAYGFGLSESRFGFSPLVRDIRVIRNGYTDAGLPCAEDPTGAPRAVGIPNSIGRKVTIQVNHEVVRMGGYSQCPMAETAVFHGTNARWPIASPEMGIP